MSDRVQVAGADTLAELLARKRWRLHHIVYLAVAVAFLLWCANGVNLQPREIWSALPAIGHYFAIMAPPKWGVAELVWRSAIETIYIAIWGNVIATLIGLPLGIMAARNITRSPIVRGFAKAVLNLLRSISELIWAIFFVAAVAWLLACFFPLRAVTAGPPFAVSRGELRRRFAPAFRFERAQPPLRSVRGRQGREWLVFARRIS